jgi:type IV pilus assembly protein PilY1
MSFGNSAARRLYVGLVLLGVAGPVSAQTVSAPPNIFIDVDTSGSYRELPQIRNSDHVEFFNNTTNGCSNPRLDATQASRGWNPNTLYPIPDPGTGLGGDIGFPNLFLDDKFYGYSYWGTSNNPPYQWASKEAACQSQVPDWNTTRAADYNQCLSCLSTKGYYKLPEAEGVNYGDLTNLDFIFWGRFLNFNPPRYVTLRAALKKVLANVSGVRVGFSSFYNGAPYSRMDRRLNPACNVIRSDPSAFAGYRASYIDSINGLTFATSSTLARSLINTGYYFTSGDDVYRDVFGFGTGYSYPNEFRNDSLLSQSRSVCWGCQVSAAIVISDGEPTADGLSSTVVSRLRALNGGPVYCPDTQPCTGGTSLSQRDKGTDPNNVSDDNPNYMLDDLAKLLANQDLQQSTPPVVGDFDTSGRQSLRIYTVGFTQHSNLLKNTADVGGGLYYLAEDAASLQQALEAIISDVKARSAACVIGGL